MELKRAILQGATAFALRIPPIREYAARELTASLRVIRDLSVTRSDYPLTAEWAARNPALREMLDEISGEILRSSEEEIMDGLRLIRPHAVKGFQKARFGSACDGGYVILDDFRSV